MASRGLPVRISAPEQAPRAPTVTVVIPCYNYGHYLPQCLESVLSQRNVSVDVIVIDDASSDGSAETAYAIASMDGRVSVHRHEHNRGHIPTYNEGLEAATGEYVALLSADDLLAPGSLARATALLCAHPNVGFAYGRAACFSDTAPPDQCDGEETAWIIWRGSDWLDGRWRIGRAPIISPEVVMRTSVQHRIGGYRTELPHTADLEMWMRAASVGDVGYTYGQDQAYYRIHERNMHRSEIGDAPDHRLEEMRNRLHTFELLSQGTESRAGLVDAAKRAIALEAMRAAVRHSRADAGPEAFVEELVDFAVRTHPDATASLWNAAIAEWRKSGPNWPARKPLLSAHIYASASGHRRRRQRLEKVGAW